VLAYLIKSPIHADLTIYGDCTATSSREILHSIPAAAAGGRRYLSMATRCTGANFCTRWLLFWILCTFTRERVAHHALLGRAGGGSCEEFMYVRTLQCVVYNSTGSNSPRRRQPAAEGHAQPLQHSRRCLLLRVLGDGGRDASSIGGGPPARAGDFFVFRRRGCKRYKTTNSANATAAAESTP